MMESESRVGRRLDLLLIFLMFLGITLSYVTTMTLGLLKYLSICLSLVLILIHTRGRFHRGRFTVGFYISILLIISCLFQPTKLSEKAISSAFYFVLIMWLFWGDQVFKKVSDIWAAIGGMSVGTIVGIVSGRSLRAVQLANIYNTRHRVWWGFGHANTLGSIAEAILLGVICILVLKHREFNKFQFLIAGITVFFTIFLFIATDSRTSLIAAIIFVGVLLYFGLRKFSPLERNFIVAILSIAVIFMVAYFTKNYLLNDAAFTGRFNAFTTLDVSPRQFLVGNGMLSSNAMDINDNNGTHGEVAIINLFYKNGIVGVIAYVVLYGYIFMNIKAIRNFNQKKVATALLIAMLIGSLGEAFLVDITNVFSMFTMLLLSALVFSNGKLSNE